MKANGNEPTNSNGQGGVSDTPTTNPTQPAGQAKGDSQEKNAALDTTTLIIIGSSVGSCIICILVLLLLVCHRRNKLLNKVFSMYSFCLSNKSINVNLLSISKRLWKRQSPVRKWSM